MLQLNHSQATNTNAVYPDVTASLGTTQVILEFTQSYDYSTKGDVIGTLANVVSPNNPWLVIQLTGSSVPTASGQYNVNIWSFTGLTGSIAKSQWINASQSFNNAVGNWGASDVITKTALLSTERAFVSGTNGVSTTTYLLPTNGGTYTTYNYP